MSTTTRSGFRSISVDLIVSTLKILIPLLIGLVVGALLVMFSNNSKMLMVLIVGSAGLSWVCVMFMLKYEINYWFVFITYFALPLPFGISFFYRELIPFEVSANGFELTIIDLCAIGMWVLWIGHRFIFADLKKPVDWAWPLLIPCLLLLIINTLSASFTPYPFFAFSIVFSHIKMIALFLILTNILSDERMVPFAVWGMILALGLQGVIGMEQKLVGAIFTAENMGRAVELKMQIGQQIISRVAGTLDHPNNFAMFLNLLIPIAVYYAWQARKFRIRLIVGGAIFAGVMAEVFSGSRSGWIALMAALALTVPLWLYYKEGKNPLVGMTIFGVIGAIVFGGLFAASASFRDRLLLDDHGTAEVRYPLMEVAENMIIANPITGVGVNHYTHYMSAYDRTADAISFVYPFPVHNTFMLVAGETGIFSMILIVIQFVATILVALRGFLTTDGAPGAVSLGIIASMVTLMIHNLGNPSAFYEDQPLYVLMATAAAVRRMGISRQEEAARNGE